MDNDRVLRSTSWHGPAPRAGDVVQVGGTLHVVSAVAAGPGLGQYRLNVTEARVITWTPDS